MEELMNNNEAPVETKELRNPYKVAEGQVWTSTDARRPRRIVVVAIDAANASAVVKNEATGRKSSVLLDRFSPGSHLRLVA